MTIDYQPGDDLKVLLTMMLDGVAVNPLSVPFEVRLWTNSKANAATAGWDGKEFYGNCTVYGTSKVQIAVDADPRWWPGELKAEAILHYPDSEMPDKSYDRIAYIEFESYETGRITGHVDHVVYGLSAYDLAVQKGYPGTLDMWLESIKGQDGKDASIKSQSFDEEGNSVITWADGTTTVIKRGKKGDNGYTPQKGVDYFDGKDGKDGKDGISGGLLMPDMVFEVETGDLHVTGLESELSRIDYDDDASELIFKFNKD